MWEGPCGGPMLRRAALFIIVASASLQGTAAANKRLAYSQKETIWPTLRMNLHLQVLTGRQQGSRLQTHVQAGLSFLVPILARSSPFLGKDLQLTSGRDWEA